MPAWPGGPVRTATMVSGGNFASAEPTLHEYEYSFRRGAFRAELVRTVHFTGNRIGFAEGLAHLGASTNPMNSNHCVGP